MLKESDMSQEVIKPISGTTACFEFPKLRQGCQRPQDWQVLVPVSQQIMVAAVGTEYENHWVTN